MGTVVALAGQVGAAKLADGLYRLRGRDLAVIVNTGDDYEHLGLGFSPDLDTMLYTLAGIASPAAGWEPEGESHTVHGMLKALGGPERPQLGDRSLAAPLLRSDGLANDRRLTQITLDFCRGLGVAARILPMSDDAVRTHVLTDDGAISFHEYFMQLGCEPAARGFQYAGADEARISDEVLDALHAADLEAVVICPANPYHVIRPILEVRGMKELLRELGGEPSVRSVAGEYLHFIDGFVIDRVDESAAESIRSLGIQVLATAAVMRSIDDRTALARAVLEFAGSIREARALEVP